MSIRVITPTRRTKGSGVVADEWQVLELRAGRLMVGARLTNNDAAPLTLTGMEAHCEVTAGPPSQRPTATTSAAFRDTSLDPKESGRLELTFDGVVTAEHAASWRSGQLQVVVWGEVTVQADGQDAQGVPFGARYVKSGERARWVAL